MEVLMKKFILPLAVLLILSFVLAGCSGTTTTPATTKPVTTTAAQTTAAVQTTKPATTTSAPVATTTAPKLTPKSGGTLNLNLVSDASSYYPPKMTGQTDGQFCNFCLETLFRFDEKYNILPWLATGWTADGNFKTITITLRKGVKFHDGSDFNAAICKWNLEQYNASAKAELKKVSSIDLVDDYTLRLNLSSFDNTIIANLSNGSDAGRMISKQSFDANGGADWAAKNPVGTGPFKFVSATKSVGAIYKRYDYYWGGKPYLDGINEKIYADQTVALMDFKAGNLDILGTTPPRDALNVQKEPTKYKVVLPPYGQAPALAGYAMDPNSIFSKLEVRQAISYATDVKTFNDSFGLGFWTVMKSWAAPGTAYDNPNIVGYPYNPTKAKALIAAATGSSAPLKCSFSFYASTQAVVDENTGLQGFLNAGGFDATLNPLQRPAFADAASNGKGWSGIIRQQGYVSPDPLIKYANYMAGAEFKGSFLNQEIIDAYNLALSATDNASKKTLTDKFLSIVVDKYCVATYLDMQATPQSISTIVQDDMYGVQPFNFLNPMTWLNR
jgi:peptide/nickel transport system substrate-binding protein